MAVSCDRIVRGLRDLGVLVDVVHFTRKARVLHVEARRNGRHFSIPVGDDPAHSLNLLLNRLEADPLRGELTHVVAFGGNLPLLAAPTLAACLALPLMVLFRGNDFDSALFSAARRSVVFEAIDRSAAVCVVSSDKERRIRALRPRTKVHWIPNGIYLEDWCALPSDREASRRWRSENVQPGSRVLGLFGQIKPKKGGLHLVESLAWSGLADRFHLLLVGDLDEEVLSAVSDGACPVRHSIFPFVDRYALLRHYLSCDAVAIPSFYDGMPNVLLEAMGLALPILGSTAGGMGDILVDGVHGFLFHPGDPHGCRQAISRLDRTTGSELSAMGGACREMALAHDPLREAKAYRQVLLDILANQFQHIGSSTEEEKI
jgi:glycosyltransferase involved in cell wall biosynthesis